MSKIKGGGICSGTFGFSFFENILSFFSFFFFVKIPTCKKHYFSSIINILLAQTHDIRTRLRPRRSIRNSWKSIFPLTPQHFGDMRERILCFLDRSETIFGPSSVFGQFTHSVFIGTHEQLILAV